MSYSSTILATTGLVAYYRLEETSSGFADATATYADGTVVSTITRGATGRVGNAIEISGKAGAVDLPQALRSGMTANNNWSLEAWIYPTALPSTVNGGMAVMWGDNGGGYGFGIFGGSDAGGSKLFCLYESIQWHDSGYTFPATNAWYHVVIKRASGTLKYFVNGTQTANTSGSTPNAPSSGSSAPRIGSRPSSLNYAFTGRIDEVAFYNAAIADADIALHYDRGLGAASDTFTDTTGTAITSHTSDSGHTWSATSQAAAVTITAAGRARSDFGTGTYLLSYTPESADYDVACDVSRLTSFPETQAGVVGRAASNEYYSAYYSESSQEVRLTKRISGSDTTLGTYAIAVGVNSAGPRITLKMRGTTISVLVNGTSQISVTDSALSAVGKGGIRLADNGGDTLGVQLDNFAVAEPIASQDLAPTGIASSEAFGTPALSLIIAPSSIASAEAFGTLVLTPGEVFVLPTGIASAEALGDLSILGEEIAPAGIASAEAFGTAVLGLGISTVGGIVSVEAFGTLTLTPGPVTIAPSGVASAEAFGTLALAQYFLPVGIASAEAFGTPALGLTIAAAGIASGEAFGTLRLSAPAPAAPYDPPRNVLFIEGGASYEWAVNHSSEDTMTLGHTADHSAPSPSLNVVRQQSAAGPLLYRLQGTIFDTGQRVQLQGFFDACEGQTVVFRHAEGDEYEVILVSLDMPAEKVGVNPQFPTLYHVWRARLEFLIVRVRAGALAEIA